MTDTENHVLQLAKAGLTLCLLTVLSAQTTLDLRHQTRNVDFSSASYATPWKMGTTLPASCTPGQAFFKADAPAGMNVYVCTAPNVWGLASGPAVQYSTGAGKPSASCVAGRDFYTDTTNHDGWLCTEADTWKKVLSSSDAGPLLITGENGTAPAIPGAGSTTFFFDSTAKVGQAKDDSGSISTMVRPKDCSTASQLVQKINPDGSVACAPGGSAYSNWQKQTASITLDGTDKTIYAATIPGGSIPPGKCLDLSWGMQHTAGSGNVSISLWFGSTSFLLMNSSDVSRWRFEMNRWCNDPGVGNSQQFTVHPMLFADSQWNPIGPWVQTTAVNTAADVIVKLTANGAATEAITGTFWLLRVY